MKKTVVIVFVLALAMCATAALAQRQGPGPASTPNRMAGPMMTTCPAAVLAPPWIGFIDRSDVLQLTEEQKTKLKDILKKADETLAPLRQKSADASQALRKGVLAPEYDAAKVAGLATRAAEAETAVVKAEIEIWTQIRPVLTAEQITKMQDLTMRRIAPREGPMAPRAVEPGTPPPPPSVGSN